MDKGSIKKKDQLGVPFGTASAKLRKSIMYHLAKRLNEHYCFQCGAEIESIEDFTIEHKKPWLDSENPGKLFFSLDNIAFSHSYCNISAARKHRTNTENIKHGLISTYNHRKCRCAECRAANAKRVDRIRSKNK